MTLGRPVRARPAVDGTPHGAPWCNAPPRKLTPARACSVCAAFAPGEGSSPQRPKKAGK